MHISHKDHLYKLICKYVEFFYHIAAGSLIGNVTYNQISTLNLI